MTHFHEHEARERQRAQSESDHDVRSRPPFHRGFDETVNDGAESQRDQQRTRPIETPLRLRVAAFGYVPKRERKNDRRQRNVDEERGTPRAMIDQPAADYRTERHGERRRGGPRADG